MAFRGGRYPARVKMKTSTTSSVPKKTGKSKMSSRLKNAAKIARKGAEFTETIANEPVETLVGLAFSLAKAMKQPTGTNGLSLMPTSARERSVSSDATGDVSTSATLYAYRPPRKRKPEGQITYIQKATTTVQTTSNDDTQTISDINVVDATPVLSNSTTEPYSRLTIKNCFDEYLKSRLQIDSTTFYESQIQQTSIHVQSITSELMVKNNLNQIALVDIYELVPQHVLGPSTYSSQTYATGYMSPTWAFTNGLVDTIEPEDNLISTIPNAKPTNSSSWYRTWKVLKKVRVNMSAGSLHRHKSCISVNKTVTYPEMAQFSTSGGKFAGWNPVYMVIQKGGPTFSATTAQATDITLSCDMEMKYTASAQEQARVIVYDQTL